MENHREKVCIEAYENEGNEVFSSYDVSMRRISDEKHSITPKNDSCHCPLKSEKKRKQL